MAHSFVTPFGKRKIYLLNHDPICSTRHLQEMGAGLSKFIILQTANEFRDGAYNDIIAGELYNTETAVRARLRADEYYLVLQVPAEAISHATLDGQVFVHKGYTPKILALKTIGSAYLYNETSGFFKEEASISRVASFAGSAVRTPSVAESRAMPAGQRDIYNYNPPKWTAFVSHGARGSACHKENAG